MRALAAPTAPTASSSLSAGRCRNQRHLKPTIVSPQHGKQQHQHHQHHLQQHDCSRQAAAVSRRAALLAGSTATPGLLLLLQPLAAPQPAAAAEAVAAASAASSTAAGSSSLQVYENTQQQYRLLVPPAWERKDKAGVIALVDAWISAVLIHPPPQCSITSTLAPINFGRPHPSTLPSPFTQPLLALDQHTHTQVLTCCLRTLIAAQPLWG